MNTPRKKSILNNKYNLKSPQFKNKIDNISLKKYNNFSTFVNKTSSALKQKELTLSSTYTLSNESAHKNRIFQCINNRYYDNLNNDFIPSINNFKYQHSRNYMSLTINSSSFPKLNTYTGKKVFNVHLIDTGELTQISTLLSSLKTPKKRNKRKNLYISKKNVKFNSLLYHLNKKPIIKDSEIENRYRPIIKEFFGKNDYTKFSTKSQKFIRPEELKPLYKDTTLIRNIFNYLNNNISNIRYRQALENQKKTNEMIDKKKKEKYYCKKVETINLPLEKFFKIKRVIYNRNIDKIVST